ncbi:MAG: two-component regulator propeller domain-containing protein, partial [Bacteroidota bacterium]
MKAQQTILTLALLYLCCALLAQHNPQPYFRNYGTEDGLPSPEVYCAFEDSQGFMWFGTDNGVARFDGYTFKAYGPAQGLMSAVVFDIYEDVEGKLWFGTITGDIFILDNGQIEPYQFNHIIQKFRGQFDEAKLVHLKADNTVFVMLDEYGVLRIDKLGYLDTIVGVLPMSNLIYYEDGFKEPIRTLSNRTKLAAYSDWYKYQETNNLFHIDVINNDQRFQKALARHKFLRFSTDAQYTPDEKLLIHGYSAIHCLADTQLLWSIPFLDATNEMITEDETIWFCMREANGLRRYKNLNQLKRGKYDAFLVGNSITNLLKDSKGNYWITTMERGVYFMPQSELVTYNRHTGISDNFVRTVAFKNEKEVFLGVENGEIINLSLENNEQLNKFESPAGHYNYNLFYDEKSELLYSGFSRRVNQNWEEPKFWNKDVNEYQIFSSKHLKKTYPIGNNKIVATHSTGFFVLNKDTHLIDFKSTDIERERTFAVYLDVENKLWVGNAHGLFKFENNMRIAPNQSHPAFKNRVEAITQLPDSTLVFGTKGYGVMLWKGDSVLQVSEKDGLTSNMLEDVHVDENGMLWAATLNGLNKIVRTTEGIDVRTFSTYTGLPSNEIYQIK